MTPPSRSGTAGRTRCRRRYVDELVEHCPEFVKAYEPDGLSHDEFETYGASARTLRAFVASYWQLVGTIDDLMMPNPDLRA